MVDINDFSWQVELPNHLRPSEKRSYWKKTLDWKHVSKASINGWRTMRGAQRRVLNDLGRPIGEVSNEELAKFIVTAFKRKATKAETARDDAVRDAKKQRVTRLLTVDDRLKAYLEHYQAKTANDLTSLRQLCALEATMADLETAEHELMRDLKDRNKKGSVSETYINSIVNARMKYLAEYRQLQVMLGIDRLTRDKADTDAGGADYTRRLINDTAQLVASKAVKIACPECAKQGTVLQMGMILSHFGGWTFTGKCPKCQAPITIRAAA